ncbi:Small ribosomal subunit protein eS17y-like protein [Drosera capensis]
MQSSSFRHPRWVVCVLRLKKSSRQVIEKYYSRMTLDCHTNKKILEELAIIPSKRLRNKIAGFSTHLMKRIQKGPVRGISLKLQRRGTIVKADLQSDQPLLFGGNRTGHPGGGMRPG